VSADEVELLVFYEKPLLKLERILQNHLDVAPRGLWQWRMLTRRLWTEKLGIERAVRSLLPGYRGEVAFVEHHEAHAASAFYPSPFEEAAVLTVDGVGEWATATWGIGRGAQLELREEMLWPHSLGLLYSAVTAALGFRVNRDEYKVMGLAAYGLPRYVDWIDQHLVERYADGTCRLRPELLTYRYGRHMVTARFSDLLGAPLRDSRGAVTEAARDLAASVQLVIEEQVLAMASHVARQTGMSALCLAGGVAYNCVANGRLREEGPFADLWIQPAAGDAGGAIGAALLGWYRCVDRAERVCDTPDGMQGALLGPTISDEATHAAVASHDLRVVTSDRAASICAAAEALARGRIVAVAAGRMEFGPRALGNRSILADPRLPGIQRQLNERVKHREGFRPFAPAVLAEHVTTVFRRAAPSPYMLETAIVRSTDDGSPDWRETIAGAVHVDGSARVQTVGYEGSSTLRAILERFHERTGCPVLINTSFNDADMPIAATADDACRAMQHTGIELLLLGNYFVELPTDRPAPRSADPGSRGFVNWWNCLRTARSILRLLPSAVADTLMTLVFFLVVCPVAAVRRLVGEAGSELQDARPYWRPRERAASDLSRLY
jgi:carbamoyltransferase